MVPIVTLAALARVECDCTHVACTGSGRMPRRLSRGGRKPAFPDNSNQMLRTATNGNATEQGSEVSADAIREMPDTAPDKHARGSVLRIVLLLLTVAQMVFVVALTVFVIHQMNPLGDGMEFAAVSAAVLLLEVPFTIPAFILAVNGKALGIAACLAGFATFAYVIFWVQVYAEVAAKSAS